MLHIIATTMALAAQPSFESGSPTPSDLIAAIDTISTDDEQSFSLEIQCAGLGAGVPATLNIYWQPNGQYSLLWSESGSGTPVALFTDAGFFVYDVVDGEFLTGSGVVPNISLSCVDDKIVFSMGFKADRDESPRFNLNLATFVDGYDRDWQVQTSETSATISHATRSQKSTLVCTFQLADTIHLKGVCIRSASSGKPVFEVSEICRGPRLGYIRLPQVDVLQLPVIEWTRDENHVGVLEGFLAPLCHAIVGQAAVDDAELRNLSMFSNEVIWSAVEERADSTRKALSDLVEP